MGTLMYLSIFWILYGVLGLFGFQFVPSKFRGYSWTKTYIRYQGIGWLMLGIPWQILCFVVPKMNISEGITIFLMIVTAMPSLICSIFVDTKYKRLLETENKELNSKL